MVRIIAKHQPNFNQTKDDYVEPIVKCEYTSKIIVLYFTYLYVPNVVDIKICMEKVVKGAICSLKNMQRTRVISNLYFIVYLLFI